MASARRRPPPIALALAGLTTASCASTTHYTTAKLLAPSEHAFVLSADATRVEDRSAGTQGRQIEASTSGQVDFATGSTPRFSERRDTAVSFIGVPTMRYRAGVTDGLQVGGFLGGRGLGAEILFGLVRGATSVALLAAPSWQGRSVYLDVPLLVSRTLHERVELLASLGAVGGLPLAQPRATDGVFARLGGGVRVRFNSWLFVFPEIVAAESLGRARRDTWVSGGLGVGGSFR